LEGSDRRLSKLLSQHAVGEMEEKLDTSIRKADVTVSIRTGQLPNMSRALLREAVEKHYLVYSSTDNSLLRNVDDALPDYVTSHPTL
jgi:hypothetical protein